MPGEVILGGKCIQISYKIITDNDLGISEIFMVILTGITYKRMLEDVECRMLLPDIIKLRQKPFKEILKGMPDPCLQKYN